MMTCVGSLFALSPSHECLVWAVPILLSGALAIIVLCVWLYKITIYRNHNLHLRILNRLPINTGSPLRSIAEPPSLKVVGTGEQRLFVEVRALSLAGFPLKSFNVRCIRLNGLDTDKPTKGVVPILGVADPIHAGRLCTFDDGFNGIDGDYSEVRQLGVRFGRRNRALHFEIVINSSVEWTGYLRFTGKDSRGFCSYGRYAIAARHSPARIADELTTANFHSRFDGDSPSTCPS